MTSESLPEAWASRDLPVLREAARIVDSDPMMAGARFQQIATATGLDDAQVLLAAKALETAGLVELRLLMPSTHGRVVAISARARELVGLWPTPENALDRIISALEAIAENTDDEDTRTRARKILDALAGAGKTIGISVAAAAITGQIPGASP